jgi:hypothetical protein
MNENYLNANYRLTADDLIYIRKSRGLSHIELGDMMGYADVSVISWERGVKIKKSVERFFKLLHADYQLEDDQEFRRAFKKIMNPWEENENTETKI